MQGRSILHLGPDQLHTHRHPINEAPRRNSRGRQIGIRICGRPLGTWRNPPLAYVVAELRILTTGHALRIEFRRPAPRKAPRSRIGIKELDCFAQEPKAAILLILRSDGSRMIITIITTRSDSGHIDPPYACICPIGVPDWLL